MKRLPPHAANTARIFDVTVHADFVVTGLREEKGPEKTRAAREGLIQFLQATYPARFDERRIFRWLNDPLLVNDIGSIASQWSQALSRSDPHLYRLVNRTSLQQDPLDLDLRPRDSYLTCAQDENNRFIVIIVHDVWSRQRFSLGETGEGDTFVNPRSVLKMRQNASWTEFSDGSLETFAKLLVLDFFEGSIYLQPVDYYEDLIYPKLSKKAGLTVALAKNPHLQVPLGLFEPRLSTKSREAFKEIEDAEGILRSVSNLVDSILCVVEDLESRDTPRKETVLSKRYDRRIQVLKQVCAERSSNAERALNALNRQLDYLTKRHTINEAKAIRILTILASFYLPLSLSGTLLGMNTPFSRVAHDVKASDKESDLYGTNLLFDFFGVFVTLATGTILIVHIIRFGLWLRSNGIGKLSSKLGIMPKHFSGPFSILSYGKRWRFDGVGGNAFNFIRIITRWFIGVGFGITLLVIFIIGMIKEAQQAWDTARWAFAAYITVSGILLVLYLVVYLVLYRKSFGSNALK